MQANGQLKAISLFSGVGGLELGVKQCPLQPNAVNQSVRFFARVMTKLNDGFTGPIDVLDSLLSILTLVAQKSSKRANRQHHCGGDCSHCGCEPNKVS